MASLKTNFVLNLINTITGIIFPIITFPYAARILMPEGIGLVNFYQSIIGYIVLLTSLGIPMYAIREVAKYRNDIEQRNRITIEIILLSAFLCLFGYIAVGLLGAFLPQIQSNIALFYILSLTILFTGIGVQWFYQGIEDFKFITYRAIAFRSFAAISLFVFVKDETDLLIYGLITVASTVGNNVINLIHLRKFICFSEIKWNEIHIWKHLKPAIHIFVLNLIMSIYINLDSVMLGFMKGEAAVGFYSAGVKMSHVVLSVITSLGAVVLPRCSNLVKTGEMKQFGAICSKSIRFVFATSLPLTIGLILLSQPIIAIFCGASFMPSVLVLQIISPIIIFAGLTSVIGIQTLYPQGQENKVIISVLGGAILNFSLNLVLIPLYAQDGAAISTFIAEFTVLVIQLIIGRKFLPFTFKDKNLLNYIFATILMMIFILLLKHYISNVWLLIVSSLLVGGTVYMGFLLFKKDSIAFEIVNYIRRK